MTEQQPEPEEDFEADDQDVEDEQDVSQPSPYEESEEPVDQDPEGTVEQGEEK